MDRLPRSFRVGDIIRLNKCFVSVFRGQKIFQGNIHYGASWILFRGASEDGQEELKDESLMQMRVDENASSNNNNLECDININSFFGMPTTPPKVMVPKP